MNIRRILIALDASPSSLVALRAAAEMASKLETELIGIFVEDINLLRLAQLPFARELAFPSAAPRELDSAGMERALRVTANKARQALAEMAGRFEIPWSFQVARGAVVAELLAAARESDLLALAKTSQTGAHRPRLGSTARGILQQSPRAALLSQTQTSFGRPCLVVLNEPSVAARQAIETASLLVRTTGDRLIVLVVTETLDHAHWLEEAIRTSWLETPVAAHFQYLCAATPNDVAQTIRELRPGAILLACPGMSLAEEHIRDLVLSLDCPVLIFREEPILEPDDSNRASIQI